MKRQSLIPVTIALSLFACDSGSAPEENLAPGAVDDSAYDALVGSEWILQDPGNEKTYTSQRLRIEQAGDGFSVLYTGSRMDRVGSGNWPRNWAADMMRYECAFEGAGDGRRLGCSELGREWEWCMPAVSRGADCTHEMLQAMDPDITEEEWKAAADKAEGEFERENRKYGKTGMSESEAGQFIKLWEALYQTDRSKLGIKLDSEGQITVVDTFRDLKVTVEGDDNEELVVKVDAASPNDRSGWDFVAYDKGDLLWEHCDLSRRYININDSRGFPDNPFEAGLPGQDRQAYAAGTELTFTHVQLSEDVLGAFRKPIDPSCRYEFDAYHRGVRVVDGQEAEVKTAHDKNWKKDRSYAILQWSYAPSEPSGDANYFPDVVHMVITRQCGDKIEKFVSCQDLEITN